MQWASQDILRILDQCGEDCAFPMLDNGYVYLAATRLTLYRSTQDWALVIEVFGYSPRAGIPDIHIFTAASRLRRVRSPESYVSREAYEAYLTNNPYNESSFVYPMEAGDWMRAEDAEMQDEVAVEAQHDVIIRGQAVPMPALSDYAALGVTLQHPPRVYVYELCRALAARDRALILATPEERRICVPPELAQILQLDAWHHPDLANGALPGSSPTFQALVEVLVTGDVSRYAPTEPPNTHWENWPEGGTL